MRPALQEKNFEIENIWLKRYISTDNEMRVFMRDVLKLFKALSDGQRLRILKMLEVRPLCVCEITEVLQLATSTVSKHLSILRDADLIRDEKDGKWVNYSLNTSQSGEYSTQILPLVSRWLPAEDLILQDAEKVRSVDRNVICGA